MRGRTARGALSRGASGLMSFSLGLPGSARLPCLRPAHSLYADPYRAEQTGPSCRDTAWRRIEELIVGRMRTAIGTED